MTTMLFDGKRGFCRRWIAKWERGLEARVAFRPYQEALPEFPQLTREQCERGVQLVQSDGRIYSGAHAVLKVLSLAGRRRLTLWCYEAIPPVRWVKDFTYRLVATRRLFFSRFI